MLYLIFSSIVFSDPILFYLVFFIILSYFLASPLLYWLQLLSHRAGAILGHPRIAMACGETSAEARRLLDLCFQGDAPEANALASLLHIHQGDLGRVVVPAALDAKLGAVLATAPEAGTAGFRAAESLVVVATFLDAGMEPPSSSGQSPPPGTRARVAVHLIGQVLQLMGGPGRAPKDKAVRTLAVILSPS